MLLLNEVLKHASGTYTYCGKHAKVYNCESEKEKEEKKRKEESRSRSLPIKIVETVIILNVVNRES